MLKKVLNLAAALVLLAAGSLCFAPMRAWASKEGSYIYHSLFVTGPAVFYGAGTAVTDSGGTSQLGVSITTGTPGAMTGVFSIRNLGALAAKPATSNEGDWYYDTAQHTVAMATATKSDNSAWLKANTATTGAAWTTY